MKFTMELESLIKMIEQAGSARMEAVGGQNAIQLRAGEGRVWVGSDHRKPPAEAMVWEDGQVTLATGGGLLGLLKSCRDRTNVTLEADAQGLRNGADSVPVIGCSPWVTPSEASLFDFAAD